MISNLWINLPVKNIEKSVRFYTEIGFKINEDYKRSNESASLFIGTHNIILMLFQNAVFEKITEREIGKIEKSTEVLFSIDSESIESVNTLSKIVNAAGGKIIKIPNGDQNMYGFSFLDIDNHSWNVLYMNEMLKDDMISSVHRLWYARV